MKNQNDFMVVSVFPVMEFPRNRMKLEKKIIPYKHRILKEIFMKTNLKAMFMIASGIPTSYEIPLP